MVFWAKHKSQTPVAVKESHTHSLHKVQTFLLRKKNIAHSVHIKMSTRGGEREDEKKKQRRNIEAMGKMWCGYVMTIQDGMKNSTNEK